MRLDALHVRDDDAREGGGHRRDLLDLQPAHGQRVRERLDIRGDVDELLQPAERDLHARNCSRNRRSFSKKRRRSFTPYLSIARRSSPMPKANPEYFSGSMPPLRSTSGCTTPAPAISR